MTTNRCNPKDDIRDKQDVVLMVNSFYDLVKKDELLGPIFNDIAQVDWESHLPKMYQFWESILFGAATYQGRPFPKHAVVPISPEHFERWVALFTKSVNRLFAGPKTEEAKFRAQSIAGIFQNKLKHLGKFQ